MSKGVESLRKENEVLVKKEKQIDKALARLPPDYYLITTG